MAFLILFLILVLSYIQDTEIYPFRFQNTTVAKGKKNVITTENLYYVKEMVVRIVLFTGMEDTTMTSIAIVIETKPIKDLNINFK